MGDIGRSLGKEGEVELLTIEQVARLLNVSKSLVYRLKDEGKLRSYRIGKGAIRFRTEDVLSYLEECVVEVDHSRNEGQCFRSSSIFGSSSRPS